MRAVDWLSGRDGAITFPGYAEHNGETAKRRAEGAKKKQKQREVAGQRDKCPVDVGTGCGTKAGPDKIREEKEGGGGTNLAAESYEPPPPDSAAGEAKPPPDSAEEAKPPPPPESAEEAEPPPPVSFGKIPTETEVVTFGGGAGIPPGYCANFHVKTTEKRLWLNTYGRLVDWQRQMVRFWAADRATWEEDYVAPKEEKWRADWLPWLEKSGHDLARNREYQFAVPYVKDQFWAEGARPKV